MYHAVKHEAATRLQTRGLHHTRHVGMLHPMPQNTTSHDASELRAELARQRISARELSRRVGETPTWVHRRVVGTTEMTVSDLARFAEAIGVPITQLLPKDKQASA